MKKTDSLQPGHHVLMVGGGRRDFLKAAALAGGGLLTGRAILGGGQLAFGAHAGGSDVLRIGLVGCGGRGTGAAADALQADPNVQLVAMADLFEDRLKSSLAILRKNEEIGKKVAVAAERQFVGFDAYKQLIASGVDVVLLATPPHFRPMHLKAAVDAGLHVFAEKPVAVDAPGVRSVLATCAEAKKKNISVVSGLCLRCSYAFRELVRRIHDGALGEIHTLQANDYRGTIWTKTRMPGDTDMHWQTRNWYYYTWLSGDFNVEQHVHFLDVCAWVMQGRYPARAIGMGGRQVRTGPQFGNIFDHHSVIYEYDDGVKFFSNTRQMAGCAERHERRGRRQQGPGDLRRRQGSEPRSSTVTRNGPSAARTTTSTTRNTTRCSPPFAKASRSTMASTWPRARCWRSSGGWPPTPGRPSPGSKR